MDPNALIPELSDNRKSQIVRISTWTVSAFCHGLTLVPWAAAAFRGHKFNWTVAFRYRPDVSYRTTGHPNRQFNREIPVGKFCIAQVFRDSHRFHWRIAWKLQLEYSFLARPPKRQ
jgi:hypothetical protein